MSKLLKALAIVVVVWLLLYFIQDGLGGWLPRIFQLDVNWGFNHATKDEVLTHAGAGLSEIVVETHNGAVSLYGSDRQDLEIRVSYRAQADSDSRAEELVRTFRTDLSASEGKLQVTANFGASSYNNQSASYEIYLPQSWSAEVNTSNGRVVVENLQGAAVVNTSNGAVDVSAAQSMEAVAIETSNGRVEVAVDGDLPNLTVDSSNGGIEVDAAPVQGCWQLETSNAGIRVSVPASLGIRLDAQTSNSSIDVGSGSWAVTGGVLSSKQVQATRGDGALELITHTSNSGIEVADR